VQRDVRAELERSLEIRRHERVVDDQMDVARLRPGGDRGDVRELHHGIRRRLDEHHLCVGAQGREDVRGILRVDERELEPEAREHALEEPRGAAVEIVARDDVIAGRQRLQQRVRRREARGVAEAMAPAFETGEIALERRAGRVVRARVLEALVLA